MCGLEKDICSLFLLNSYISGHLAIFAFMPANRVVTESLLQTCFGSTKTRGEMWFVFFAFEILLQKGGAGHGAEFTKEKAVG